MKEPESQGELQSDLLAYVDVPKDIDAVYRAFLDTCLLGMASEANDSDDPPYRYWVAVMDFRREKLGVAGQPASHDETKPGTKVESRVAEILARVRKSNRARQPDVFVNYLFWFDVRANHWFLRLGTDLRKVASTVLPADYLARLYADVVALQQRIESTFPGAATTVSQQPGSEGPGQQLIDAMDADLGVGEFAAEGPWTGGEKSKK